MAKRRPQQKEDAATVLAQAAKRHGVPSTATLQLTTYCNYRCAHCYQDHGSAGDSEHELSLSEIERILTELADCGILLLTLTGGEVFTRLDILDVVGIAHRLGFAIRVKTTGHFIDPARADALAAARPLQVDLSLYGSTPAIHEAITRVPGSWDRVISAARLLIERGVIVTLSMPIMESNAADAGNVAELARKLGAEWTSDPVISPVTSGDFGPVGLRPTWATLLGYYSGKFTDKVPALLSAMYLGADLASFRPLDGLACNAASSVVTISPSGEILPCNMLTQSGGSLRDQGFLEIWRESAALAELRELPYAAISECNVCELRSFCRRCHAIALAEHESMTGPSLEACRHAVAIRDVLRDQGIVPATHTGLPPTWDRVDLDGQHHRCLNPRAKCCG